ncbi:MAG TPA: hypothetical protein PKD55_21040, partial [Bellilinea sp.]|nr:hypothetical protein [Bellilinea sp.]
ISSMPVTKDIISSPCSEKLSFGFSFGFEFLVFDDIGVLLDPAALVQAFDDANHEQIARQIPIRTHSFPLVEEEDTDKLVIGHKWCAGIALGGIRRFLKFQPDMMFVASQKKPFEQAGIVILNVVSEPVGKLLDTGDAFFVDVHNPLQKKLG